MLALIDGVLLNIEFTVISRLLWPFFILYSAVEIILIKFFILHSLSKSPRLKQDIIRNVVGYWQG